MDRLTEIKQILHTVGPDRIWRPVYDPQHNLLAQGIGEARDGLEQAMDGVTLHDKTVADLGCNFGHYTFWARRNGARQVVGIDRDARIIRGCNLLKALYHMDRIEFRALDLLAPHQVESVDMGLMIDFIGKTIIRAGLVTPFLRVLENWCRREMLLTVRPRYHVYKNLGGDVNPLRKQYGGRYFHGNFFHVLDYVRDQFKERWEMRRIALKTDPEGAAKETLHFIKKGVSA